MPRVARWFLSVLLFPIITSFLSSASKAQTLDLSSTRLVIGAKLQGSYSVPDGEDQPRFGVGLRRKGHDDYYWTQWVPNAGRGTMDLVSPNDPGQFEAVLFDDKNVIHAVVPFGAVVTPTPGALRPDKTQYIVGEPITLSVRTEQNRFYGNGWVGFFRQGQHGEGGASIADQRLTWQRIPPPDKPLTFTAPADPGTYEFRLFDRDAWRYVLDRAAVKVVLPPTPGAMALEKKVFTIGEPLNLQVQLEKGRHYGNAWIGLFRSQREAPGGGIVRGGRLTWQRVNTKTEQLAFTTPDSPGLYEFRLYDRDDWHYVLDSIAFEVIVPPTPGVMSLPKDTFTIGESIPLRVKLEQGRYYGNAWIGLYRSERAVPGGAKIERDRLTYQRVNIKTDALNFTAPPDPGDYEFLLFDRDAGQYGLDRLTFKVEVPPTPGVMSLAQDTFIIGESIPLRVKLEPGRYYGNAWIGLYRKDREAAGGGSVVRRRHTYQRVNTKTEQLTFTAPNGPGDYQFRLYDRDASHYLLDTLDFKVTVPPTPGVLSLSKDTYVTGEPLRLAVGLRAGRYYGNAWVGLYRKSWKTENGAGVQYGRLGYQRANLETEALDWTAPDWPGEYEFRLFDRDAGHFLIDSVGFKVTATPQSGLLSVQKSRYRPGELVRVRVRLPENRTNGSAWVELARSGHAINGGALGDEYNIKSFRVGKDSPALAFEAPREAGPYELRFYDRDGSSYILDIKTFTVADEPPTGLERTPVRFTPMPGGPSVAMRPGPSSGGGGSDNGRGGTGSGGADDGESDGLPGRPVRPDGQPVAQPETAGGAGGDTAGGDTPTDQTGDTPSGSRPSLRFVAIGADGLSNISSIKVGQPFIIEARYAEPPEGESVTARLSYGGGGGQAIVLTRAGERGLYRSGVIRLPGGGN